MVTRREKLTAQQLLTRNVSERIVDSPNGKEPVVAQRDRFGHHSTMRFWLLCTAKRYEPNIGGFTAQDS
jgi:hypothetical protein